MQKYNKSRLAVFALIAIACLALDTVGCGSSSSGGGGAAGPTSTANGTVFASSVSGATIRFFSNAATTAEIVATNAPVKSAADGTYSASFNGTLPRFLFMTSTGGVDSVSGAAGPNLFGVTSDLGTGSISCALSVNPLATLIAAEMSRPTNAASTPEEAYQRIRAIFPSLPADSDVGLALINFTTPAGFSGLIQTIIGILDATAASGGNTSADAIATLAIQLAGGSSSALATLKNQADQKSVPTGSFVDNFAISALFVGTQNCAVPTQLTNGNASFGAPSQPINVNGSTPLPDVTINASNVPSGGFADGTNFPGATLNITISGTGTDKRVLSFTVDKARATVQTGGQVSFTVDAGANFTLSGTDTNGAAIPVISAINAGADTISSPSAGGSFTFHTDALVNQMRTRLGVSGFTSTNPAFLIASQGSFNLSFTSLGIPFGLAPAANGFKTLTVSSVNIAGQHNFSTP